MRRAAVQTLRAAYDAQHRLLVAWLAALPGSLWHRPSALAAWTVRHLAFHTTEVPGSLTRALADGPVRAKPLTVAQYTAAWAPAAREIAQRETSGAAGLVKKDILDRHDTEHAAMSRALDAVTGDPTIPARRGPIRLSDFLATRVNELVVHSRDLSASLPDRDPVPLDRDALGISVRLLLGVLAERVPGRSVEVRVPPYGVVQCVEGPRHTRGTPPNEVEVEPLAWVEVATGRLSWSAVLAEARARASGERADLSAYLPVLS